MNQRYMCVTLWQDFIGAAFLASLAPRATTAAAAHCWTLDLHCAAAVSKPSPYLPVCVVATAAQTSPGSPGEQGGGEDGQGETGEGAAAGGGGVRVAAWCDRAGRPLAPGGEPAVLKGQMEVCVCVFCVCKEGEQDFGPCVDIGTCKRLRVVLLCLAFLVAVGLYGRVWWRGFDHILPPPKE